MTMYLLLRDNKQSGPYSLDELKSMGLKAYDLVWLDGKSAAWRYPSEIEELKSFAPVVEEQPFDRFYRRPDSTTAAASTTATTDSPVPVTVETSKTPGKRIIYVTMPAARNTSVFGTRESTQSFRENVQPLREQQPVVRVEQPALREQPAPAVEPARPVYTSPRAIEDYAAPNDGDKAVIEEFFPRKKRSPRAIRLVVIGICILALLAA